MLAYNGYLIEPAPFISITKAYDELANAQKVGKNFQITLQGKFVPDRGSPTSSGTVIPSGLTPGTENVSTSSYLSSLLQKQKALENLFSPNGKQLYVQGYDGASALTCNPRVRGIDLPQGNPTSWANIEDYKINLEAEVIYIGGIALTENDTDLDTYHVSSAEDITNLEVLDENLQTYRFTRQITAKGKLFYSTSGTIDKQPWQNARDYVLNKRSLGINMTALQATGVLNNNSSFSGYNYVRGQNINELNGTFSVNETWIAYDGGTATDEYEANIKTDTNGRMQVDLQGKVQGLEVRNGTTRALVSTKSQNAVSKFNSIASTFYVRATGLCNTILNPVALSSTVGNNPITGTITYNYGYDNRPSNSISGSLVEQISVNFQYTRDLFAEIPVLGRAAGPVLQSIQTITSSKKSVQIEAILPAQTYTASAVSKPDTNVLISGFVPTATWVFKDGDQEQWDYKNGKYSRQIQWTYGN